MSSKVFMHRSAHAEAEKCTVCEEDGRPEKEADVWCEQCQKSLCSACLQHHSRYNKSHVTMAVQQIKNCSGVLQAERHLYYAYGRQPELLCLDCGQAKCTDCVRQCESLGHAAPHLLKGPEDLGRVLAEVLIARAEAGNNTSIAQRQQLHFGPASSSFQLPFNCSDLSVTSEGHLLLAAYEQGMRELDVSGNELSSWPTPIQSDKEDEEDRVQTVAALDDGRALVGVFWSRLLVLLQRSSADRAAWIVERRVAELLLNPQQLSVLGDVVAVALHRQLQLVRLSSGQSLYSDSKDYEIQAVTLTSAGVVTAGRKSVKLSDGSKVDAVHCWSHRGEPLWKHLLSDMEIVIGVCAAPGRQLLMCVHEMGASYLERNGYVSLISRVCVRVIDGEDGKMLEDVLRISSHRLMQPERLSLSRGMPQQQILAVLSADRATQIWNKVAIYTEVSS